MADAAPAWRLLASRSTNVFATWEWAETWWRHFGAEREPFVLLCKTGEGEPFAIFPLFLERWGPLRVIRFIGDGTSDDVGPVCAPGDGDPAGRALERFLAGRGGWDLLIGRSMGGDKGWSDLLRARTLRRGGSPLVDLGGRSWEEFLAERSSHFRQRTVKMEDRLRRDHGLRVRLVEEPADLPAAFDALLGLHLELRAGRMSSFMRSLSFHRDFTRVALECGWLRLRVLELEGEPGAAVLDYSYGGVVQGYQLGLQQRWRRLVHARLLITAAIRAAYDEGASEYRLGRGSEDYKYQLADRDPGVETLVKGRGFAGGALEWAMNGGRGLRHPFRRLQRRSVALGRKVGMRLGGAREGNVRPPGREGDEPDAGTVHHRPFRSSASRTRWRSSPGSSVIPRAPAGTPASLSSRAT